MLTIVYQKARVHQPVNIPPLSNIQSNNNNNKMSYFSFNRLLLTSVLAMVVASSAAEQLSLQIGPLIGK